MSDNERDELFQLMLGRTTTKAVERILAAGYRKPRTITTVEELDALPNGATLKSLIGGEPVGRVWGKVEGQWWGLALHSPDDPVLPAALIHLGYPSDEATL